ncbi:unnamed protein product [Adineta ricciae]|uniref:EGF-like domain-containing protein n=1 Tax=Adineta ricciae TaxID=249248 RepID=A0A815YM03_ADIRI|nr:unnamed protein product [Adineta ricciae]
MIVFLSVFFLCCLCSTTSELSVGHDIGQYYSKINLYEYVDYSNVKFLKFNIYGPTTLANWSVTISNEGKCSNYFPKIHFDLQYGAYPLISPLNESFPESYISSRHDLLVTIFNRTISNGTVQLENPLIGTWFAMVFIEKLPMNSKSKIFSSDCNLYLTSWLDYQAVPVLLTLTIDQPLSIILSNNTTFVYTSYYTTTRNARLIVLSNWTSDCMVTISARINALPSLFQYDYQTTCQNSSCVMELDQLAAFLWIYFQITVNDSTCQNTSIAGDMLIRFQDDIQHIQSYPTRRIVRSFYYDFIYVPLHTNSSTHSIILSQYNASIYSYEFIVDDRNIGGTIHFDFDTQLKPFNISNMNVSILGCLSKNQPRRHHSCENDYKILLQQNSLTVRSLPYPEMGLWYLTLEYACNDSNNHCDNATMLVNFQVLSSQCTRQQCGIYGVCRIMISQQNIFSACTCLAGYRGYGCTDGTYSHVSRYLPSVLFLTLSNLMFIPAVVFAIYNHLYIEALVYSFNMFFSTFYHACDQEIRRFCIFKYDGLQLSDFIGSYASFIVTLITISFIPRSVKIFLFMLGVLTCVVINSRDRFDNIQFIVLISITFSFTLLTWIVISVKKRRLQLTRKRLVCICLGLAFAITGLILFAFFETNDNYWYTHSLWHMLMAISILFFLPQKKGQGAHRKTSIELNLNVTSNQSVGVVNEGAILPTTETNNQRDMNTSSTA